MLLTLACSQPEDRGRGATPIVKVKRASSARFDHRQSAAFFAGVRTFHDPSLLSVMYAVDDAVDLAYMFAFERNVALVRPQDVVLALSGDPVKEESRQRLTKLTNAGARVTTATRDEILTRLEEQAKKTGPDGIFIAGFASHGFMTDGVPYVLSTTSSFGVRRNSVSSAKIFDIAATAGRSLILIDACRERTDGAVRGSVPQKAPTAMLQRMPAIQGQVVLYAGTFTYDDHKKKNGVFTSAVLDSLRCDMQRDARGVVTATTLADSVEKRVLKWINANRDPSLRKATQVIMDIDAKAMPLASCARIPGIHRVQLIDNAVVAFDENGDELWRQDLTFRAANAKAADLDGDTLNEALVSTANTIAVFDADQERIWTAATPSLRSFITADLFRKKRNQVVALAGERLMIFDPDGTQIAMYAHSRELQHVVADRMTTSHSPRIVAADVAGRVFMLNPKKVQRGRELWQGTVRPASAIRRLEMADYDNDGNRDIIIRTATGHVVLAFDGHVLHSDGVRFVAIK
ncbi:MAG TPA: caspase family protein [Thermoanaerobaculia bacterium]